MEKRVNAIQNVQSIVYIIAVTLLTLLGFVGGGLFANRSIDQIFEPVHSKWMAFKRSLEPTPQPVVQPSLNAEPTNIIAVTPRPTGNNLQTGIVSNIIDGDTIEVDIDGVKQQVKYIGVDAPALGECYGNEAKEKNKSIVLGKTVQLEKDVTNKDAKGNLLRYIAIGEYDVASDLAEQGYVTAISVAPDTKYQRFYNYAALQAKENKRGLWEVCTTITPSPTAPAN